MSTKALEIRHRVVESWLADGCGCCCHNLLTGSPAPVSSDPHNAMCSLALFNAEISVSVFVSVPVPCNLWIMPRSQAPRSTASCFQQYLCCATFWNLSTTKQSNARLCEPSFWLYRRGNRRTRVGTAAKVLRWRPQQHLLQWLLWWMACKHS